MIEFQSWIHVLIGAAIVSIVGTLLMLLHVQINYAPEMRDIVRPRAAMATLVVTFPICTFFFWQMLKNFRLSEELRRLVARDSLTDAATRDYFFARLEGNDDAYGVSLMVDIDHFKTVNDTHGHIVGDIVIRSVADILRTHVRESDIVCRFGGEEFVIFLHGADLAKGYDVAERMRREIAAKTHEIGDANLRVTVSIGGSLKARLADINLAIKEADDALYQAKSAGRNQTVFTQNDAIAVNG